MHQCTLESLSYNNFGFVFGQGVLLGAQQVLCENQLLSLDSCGHLFTMMTCIVLCYLTEVVISVIDGSLELSLRADIQAWDLLLNMKRLMSLMCTIANMFFLIFCVLDCQLVLNLVVIKRLVSMILLVSPDVLFKVLTVLLGWMVVVFWVTNPQLYLALLVKGSIVRSVQVFIP